MVQQGTPIIRLDNLNLRADEKVTKARLQELRARYSSIVFDRHAQAKMLQEEINVLKSELSNIQGQLKNLVILSPMNGYFIPADNKDLKGRYFTKGAVIARVVDHNETTALVVVTQKDVGLVRKSTNSVDLRLAQEISEIHGANITREIPGASKQLPSKALGVIGGGKN